MSLVSPQQVEQFHREGYFILQSVIPTDIVDALRSECMRFVQARDRELEAKGLASDGITHYKKRYFIHGRDADSPIMTEFLFSDLMAEICRATLGDNAYLFHEQYVVKAADTDSKFAWHQDSGYIGHYHRAYLSCWCALDDMSVENGTVYILPYSRDGRQVRLTTSSTIRSKNAATTRWVTRATIRALPAIVPAGSIVVFSSRTFHRQRAQS